MANGVKRLGLLYESSAYVETLTRPQRVAPGSPSGLMGRQVAGKEFLDALLSYGNWEELIALVNRPSDAQPLAQLCKSHPSSRSRRRRLQWIELENFHRRFFPDPPARLLHLPVPLDARFAWVRQQGGEATFALSGVTHTLSSPAAVSHLRQLVTAPYECFDALICTSQAVVDMVQSVTETYAGYLRDRHGGQPGLRLRLEKIPLGVDTQRFSIPTPHQRDTQRQVLGIGENEVVVLFVGRLSHHAKAHPFPMFAALQMAARSTDQPVHLILAGWASNQTVKDAFADAAQSVSPLLRVSFVDGTDPVKRFAVWQAADIFTSLSDNIQETFGLVIVEALASGLPIVASDWNGYRDLMVDGQHGYLVPTYMVRDATTDVTARLMMGELNYDHFLGQCSQTVSVDIPVAAQAFGRLISDAPLRRQMGKRGRQYAERFFSWSHVIARYEQLWQQLETERLAWQQRSRQSDKPHPAAYPPPEVSYRGYPTRWLDASDHVEAPRSAGDLFQWATRHPLANYECDARITDPAILQQVLDAAASPIAIHAVEAILQQKDATRQQVRATIAWMLKYYLLQVVQ